MLQIATDSDSIIMDFFSGSATTAHAVMAQNFQDVYDGKPGKRKFIMVQLPERAVKNPRHTKSATKTYVKLARKGSAELAKQSV